MEKVSCFTRLQGSSSWFPENQLSRLKTGKSSSTTTVAYSAAASGFFWSMGLDSGRCGGDFWIRFLVPGLWNLLAVIQNLYARSEPLVVLVLHDFTDVNIVQVEVQGVIRARVGRKPVLAIDLLPPGGELGIEMFFLALLFCVTNFRNGLAIGLHDLEIMVVDPDPALEIAFLANDLFGSDVEDVAMQFVFLLLADVEDVVFRNFLAGEHKGQAVADILNVAFIERQAALFEGRLRGEHHVLDAVALVVKYNVEDFLVLTGYGVTVEGLYLDVLPVGVLVAGLFELLFLSGEALMISSGVMLLGGSLWRGPSCAADRAGRENANRTRNRKIRCTQYIGLVLSKK